MQAGSQEVQIIFNSSISFEERCRFVLDYQLKKNPVYRTFSSVLGVASGEGISSADDIPLLPVRAFKQARLISSGKEPQLLFKSSGTGQMQQSVHYIADATLYKTAIESEFYKHFPVKLYSVFAWMPGYHKNPDSSLIWMIEHLISKDTTGLSCFLPAGEPLDKSLFNRVSETGRNVILFGAAFGLLDLAELNAIQLPAGSHILETGGMKTYRREISKKQLREQLSHGFGVPQQSIHSEYGMCELLSQCYAIGGEWFATPHWVRVTIRRPEDPSKICEPGEEGRVGIIDLANLFSCPFILTDDRGVAGQNGFFKLLGRWNPEDLRGCNFLIDRD